MFNYPFFISNCGTDLYNAAVEQSVIPAEGAQESNERHQAIWTLKIFPSCKPSLSSFQSYCSADKIFIKILSEFLLRFTDL